MSSLSLALKNTEHKSFQTTEVLHAASSIAALFSSSDICLACSADSGYNSVSSSVDLDSWLLLSDEAIERESGCHSYDVPEWWHISSWRHDRVDWHGGKHPVLFEGDGVTVLSSYSDWGAGGDLEGAEHESVVFKDSFELSLNGGTAASAEPLGTHEADIFLSIEVESGTASVAEVFERKLVLD